MVTNVEPVRSFKVIAAHIFSNNQTVVNSEFFMYSVCSALQSPLASVQL